MQILHQLGKQAERRSARPFQIAGLGSHSARVEVVGGEIDMGLGSFDEGHVPAALDRDDISSASDTVGLEDFDSGRLIGWERLNHEARHKGDRREQDGEGNTEQVQHIAHGRPFNVGMFGGDSFVRLSGMTRLSPDLLPTVKAGQESDLAKLFST